jgi:multiple sugar transport system ATP-binding protein
MAMADRIVAMKDGIIQQVGTPEELYYHPCNMFVAGFLGTDNRMTNFWETKVSEQNGDVYINWGETKIKLPEFIADKASAYIGKEVHAGIRPEDMYGLGICSDDFNAPDLPHLDIIEADVEIREFLGDRTYLHCRQGDNLFIVRVLSQFDLPAAHSGDKIKVGIPREKIYLVDK